MVAKVATLTLSMNPDKSMISKRIYNRNKLTNITTKIIKLQTQKHSLEKKLNKFNAFQINNAYYNPIQLSLQHNLIMQK